MGSVTATPGLFACQEFLTLKVALIRNDVQMIAAPRGFRRLRHRRQLRSIGASLPPPIQQENHSIDGVFTQPGSFATPLEAEVNSEH
ncbi:hypothetical protein ACVWXO_001862 [Bradyrhizobium sp. LM2.7]